MTHFSKEKWLAYVQDELNETERHTCEDHLYACDQCLSLYMEAIDEGAGQPIIEDDHRFAEGVMQKIAETKQPAAKGKQAVRRSASRRTVLLHYVLAAAMTLLLTSTGLFNGLLNVVSHFEASSTHHSSLVEELVNKPISLTNSLDNKGVNQE